MAIKTLGSNSMKKVCDDSTAHTINSTENRYPPGGHGPRTHEENQFVFRSTSQYSNNAACMKNKSGVMYNDPYVIYFIQWKFVKYLQVHELNLKNDLFLVLCLNCIFSPSGCSSPQVHSILEYFSHYILWKWLCNSRYDYICNQILLQHF